MQDFVSTAFGNYEISHQNSAQLETLQGWVREQHEASKK